MNKARDYKNTELGKKRDRGDIFVQIDMLSHTKAAKQWIFNNSDHPVRKKKKGVRKKEGSASGASNEEAIRPRL